MIRLVLVFAITLVSLPLYGQTDPSSEGDAQKPSDGPTAPETPPVAAPADAQPASRLEKYVDSSKEFRKGMWSNFQIGRLSVSGAPADLQTYEINYFVNFPVWSVIDVGGGIRNILGHYQFKQLGTEISTLTYELAWDARVTAGLDYKSLNLSAHLGYGATAFSKANVTTNINGEEDSKTGDGPDNKRLSLGAEIFWDYKDKSGFSLGFAVGSLSGNFGNDVGYSLISIGVRSI